MPTTAGRLARAAVVAWVALVLALLPVAGSIAAGTGGIEISPYPGVVNGKQVTAFHVQVPRRGSASVRYSLRNTTNGPKTGRVYSASAARSGSSWSIGDAGSSPYIDFPSKTVALQGGEAQVKSFRVRGKPDKQVYGALVVEVTNGAITQRAATIVYLTPGPLLSIPLLLALVAAVLLVLAGTAIMLTRRRQRPTPA